VLNYLVNSAKQLITMMIIVGIVYAFLRSKYNTFGLIAARIGIGAGFVLAVIMACMKNFTNKVDTGMWNLRIYTVSAAALCLLLIFTAIGKKAAKLSRIIVCAAGLLIIAMIMLYALPDFFTYPHTVFTTEKTALSSAFLYKMIGAVLGLILTFLVGLAVCKGAGYLKTGTVFLLMCLIVIVNTMKQVAASFSIMLAKRIIASNHTLFVIAKYASNYSDWFIYATLIIALAIPVILWVQSFHVNEPYSNNAEHRKILAKWRNIRRWSNTALITIVLTVLTMTVVNAIANRKVELSPIEDAEVKDGAVYVPFEMVSDGHLHRFGYTTDNGVTIRFIVIQKPNSSAYGVGLDACDICGETGYYEKNGQVVCNLCDVVMNINTIGFKGGCNPIVIPYDIHDGNIVVPVDGLVEYESEFK